MSIDLYLKMTFEYLPQVGWTITWELWEGPPGPVDQNCIDQGTGQPLSTEQQEVLTSFSNWRGIPRNSQGRAPGDDEGAAASADSSAGAGGSPAPVEPAPASTEEPAPAQPAPAGAPGDGSSADRRSGSSAGVSLTAVGGDSGKSFDDVVEKVRETLGKVLGPKTIAALERCQRECGRLYVYIEEGRAITWNWVMATPWELAGDTPSEGFPSGMEVVYIDRWGPVPTTTVDRFPGDGSLKILVVLPGDDASVPETGAEAGKGALGVLPEKGALQAPDRAEKLGVFGRLMSRWDREELLDLFQGCLLRSRRLRVTFLEDVSRLGEVVREAGGFHIVQWSGHGRENFLAQTATRGWIKGSDVAQLLTDGGKLPPALAFFACCKSGRSLPDGTEYRSLASGLIKQGTRQVIVMRFPVNDLFARRLTVHFYASLLGGPEPVVADVALARARRRVYEELSTQRRRTGIRGDPSMASRDYFTPVAVVRERVAFRPMRQIEVPREVPPPFVHLVNPLRDPRFQRPDRLMGRDEIVAKLLRWVADPRQPVGLLHGPDGVGKSALAAELMHMQRRDFQLILPLRVPEAGFSVVELRHEVGRYLAAENLSPLTPRFPPELKTLLPLPGGDDARASEVEAIRGLLALFRACRVLIVLDGVDPLIAPYATPDPELTRPLGDNSWGAMIRQMVDESAGHQSKLLLVGIQRVSLPTALPSGAGVGPCFEVGNLKPEFGKRLLDSWGKLTVQCNIQTGELARIAAERPVALKPLASATFDIDCPSIRESGAWKYVEGDTPEGWALRSRGWAVPDRPRWRHPELEMLFLWVPPGRFLMGTSGDPRSPCYFRYHHPSEQPARHADVPHGYWIAEMPVTDAVYWQFIRYQRHRRPVSWGRPHRLDGRPVVEVDYFDTLAFCQWLSSFGLMPPGCTAFGLPTEIQWEYAARGDTGQPYPWGTEPPDHDLACCGRDFGHGADRVGVRPLGRSPFGCQDMVGNVWEWCRDVWRPDHNLPRPGEAPLDPWLRVARGGSYFTAVHHAHCAMRTAFGMDARERNLGFRVICI